MNDNAYLVKSTPCSLLGMSLSQNRVGIYGICLASGPPSLDLPTTYLKDGGDGHVGALPLKICQALF